MTDNVICPIYQGKYSGHRLVVGATNTHTQTKPNKKKKRRAALIAHITCFLLVPPGRPRPPFPAPEGSEQWLVAVIADVCVGLVCGHDVPNQILADSGLRLSLSLSVFFSLVFLFLFFLCIFCSAQVEIYPV